MIEYLISKGADLNALDSDGRSPLDLAISETHAEAAKLIADHGGKRIWGPPKDNSHVITVRP